MSLSNHAAFWVSTKCHSYIYIFLLFGVELRLTFLLGIRPYISGLIPRRPFTPKMTSLHIEPTSPGNTSVAIYIGDSKIYLDTTGFKPTWTYLLKVKDPYRTVSAVPAPILCEASVFNEALHLLTTHSIAQRLREPALSAIFPVDPLYVRWFRSARHRFTACRILTQRLAVFPVSCRAPNDNTSYR